MSRPELRRPRGLADPAVVVLDPCCGTGAYLLEVARCIAEELRREGDADVIGVELLKAFEERVIGFEILTAPFAIAQLQLYILLAELGVELPAGHRLAILTNALTGWRDHGDVKLNFPEMREEFDAPQAVKHAAKIIVVLGNPPYDRFAGAALAEAAELVAPYKGIELVEERGKDGQVKLNEFGRPRMKQHGQSLLYKEGLANWSEPRSLPACRTAIPTARLHPSTARSLLQRRIAGGFRRMRRRVVPRHAEPGGGSQSCARGTTQRRTERCNANPDRSPSLTVHGRHDGAGRTSGEPFAFSGDTIPGRKWRLHDDWLEVEAMGGYKRVFEVAEGTDLARRIAWLSGANITTAAPLQLAA